MNELTTPNKGHIVSAENSPKPPSAVLKPYLGPHVALRHLNKEICEFIQDTDFLRYGSRSHDFAKKVAFAEELARKLPADADLNRLLDAMPIAGVATHAEIASIIGAMCDSLATFDAMKAPGYLDMLLLTLELESEIERFSAQALAGAAFKILRSERFAPEPDKLVAAVREEQKAYRCRAHLLGLVLERRGQLRDFKREGS